MNALQRTLNQSRISGMWIELYNSGFANDNNLMVKAFVHAMMIATVLVCPALGGRCCDTGAAEPTAETVIIESCGSCCCHDSERSTPSCPSENGSCPGECHDCFCAGALPVGPSALDSLSFDLIAFDFVVLTPASTLASLHRASARLDVFQWPPTTGERLATLCTLLI